MDLLSLDVVVVDRLSMVAICSSLDAMVDLLLSLDVVVVDRLSMAAICSSLLNVVVPIFPHAVDREVVVSRSEVLGVVEDEPSQILFFC